MALKLKDVMAMTEAQARDLLERMRWRDGKPRCSHCGSSNVTRLNGRKDHKGELFQCNKCRKKCSVRTGTIFEASHRPLKDWLVVFYLMACSKKGVSALQVKRMIGVTYKTAWFMCHRVRHAVRAGSEDGLLAGKVEVDETYVGGKTRKGIRGRGSERKTPVMALVERDGRVRTRVIEHVDAKTLKGAIRELVDRDSTIMTDEWASYRGIGKDFKGGHKFVNHGKGEYVRGDAFTNSAESWFALLKRGIHGSFHHVSKKHLHRYCDEFAYRWDQRRVSDGERMLEALRRSEGKRLTYNPLCN